MSVSKNRKLTLKDVAQALNVSAATISNAFNRPDQLSAQLRQHILAECKRLGYRGPNATARSLRTGRSGIVGIVLSDNLSYSLTDPVANEFIRGIAEVFDRHRINMLLLSAKDTGGPNGHLPESIVDGFIIYGGPKPNADLSHLTQQHKPIITVDCDLPDTLSVNVMNYEGAKQGALLALAHKPSQVAILGLRMIDTDRVCRVREDELFDESRSVSIRRLHGYLDALKEQNYQLAAEWIWNVPDNSPLPAMQAAREALMSHPRPQLLLCMSDRIAQAAIQVAAQMGINVPQELKVLGFDGISEGALMHPSLTTIYQHNVAKGRAAAELFLGLREAKSIILPTELIIRESCPQP